MKLEYNTDWQTQTRGTNSQEYYGEGELDYTGTSYTEAKENAEACDETEIVLRKGQEEGTWFLCNNFNDEPDEIVADYSDNEVGHAWQKAYDTECYGELCKEVIK